MTTRSSPNLQRIIHKITVTQIALAEHVVFRLPIHVFAQTFHLVLQLELFRDFIIQNCSSFFKLLLQDAKSNRVKNFFHQPLSSDALNFLNQKLFFIEVLVVSCSFAPSFPGCKLHTGSLCSLLLAGMLEPQENSLFKPGFSYNVRDFFVPLEKRVALAESQPDNVGLTNLPLSLSLNNSIEKIVLSLPPFNKVSPSAECISLSELGSATQQPFQLFRSFGPSPDRLTMLHTCLSPEIKELLFSFEFNRIVNQKIALPGFMNTVKSVPVPQTQVSAFGVAYVFCNHAVQFRKTPFQVSHLFCCVVNLQKCVFALFMQVFIQNLN